MRTTVNINDALLNEIRARAELTGRTFRQTLEETIKVGLAKQGEAKRQRRFRVQPHDLQLKAGFRNQSLNQLYDQLEAEDSAR